MKKFKSFLTALGAIFLLIIVLSIFRGTFKSEVIPGEKIALLEIKGVISDSSYYVKKLEDLSRDDDVKAIVLRVDSPGGVVAPCQEIYNEVKRVKEKKPVVISMGSVAASGGLYISLPATKIVANPGTITGSIGVVLQTFNFKKIADRIGLKVITIKSGKHKDLLNPFKEVDPSDIGILQSMIDDTYDQFVKAVSESRGIPEEEVRKIGDGRVFTGRMAKKFGLVDEIGDLNKAINIAKEISKSPKASLYRVKREKSFVEKLFGEKTEAIFNSLSSILEGNVEKVNLMYILD
jgi:protease-4